MMIELSYCDDVRHIMSETAPALMSAAVRSSVTPRAHITHQCKRSTSSDIHSNPMSHRCPAHWGGSGTVGKAMCRSAGIPIRGTVGVAVCGAIDSMGTTSDSMSAPIHTRGSIADDTGLALLGVAVMALVEVMAHLVECGSDGVENTVPLLLASPPSILFIKQKKQKRRKEEEKKTHVEAIANANDPQGKSQVSSRSSSPPPPSTPPPPVKASS